MKSVLVVDDNVEICESLQGLIKNVNFLPARNSNEMFSFLDSSSFDLILMDYYLSAETGKDIASSLKKTKFSHIPIVLMSGCSNEDVVSDALNQCIDDYVSKSNSMSLIKAKINANLRKFSKRDEELEKKTIIFKLNDSEYSICFKDINYQLTKKEFLIMKMLNSNPEKCFSRKELNSYPSGSEVFVSDRSIDSFVVSLRNKLQNQNIIKTIRGQGYKINLEESV